MDFFNNFQDILDTPTLRHAAMVHFPIVLSVLIVPLLLASLVRRKSTVLRWTAVIGLVLLAGSAFFAGESGEDAEGATGQLIAAASEAVHEHEELGEYAWMFGAGTLVLFIASMILKKAPRRIAAVLTFLASLATLGWMMETAHHGGQLVYTHGVGTATIEAPPDPADDVDLETASPELAHFTNTVWPILQDNCLSCHDAVKSKSGLNMESRESLLAGGDYGMEFDPPIPAIVPGKPDEGTLMASIRHTHEDLEMPYEKDKLADADIAAIEKWIRDGAVWFEADADAGNEG